MNNVRVVLYGVGAVGSRVARFLLEKKGIEIVGAIDVAKDKVGRDLGEALGIDKRLGVVVSDDIDTVLSKAKADVVVHATSSFLKDVYPQLQEVVAHGVNVVSTCEELSYPYATDPELAEKLDELAKTYKVTVLGTGINPGFLMDTLVITLTSVCQKVNKIQVVRLMDAGTRRVPFQKKVGAGLSISEFRERLEKKTITGHVGLKQSIAMIADALDWKLDEIEIDPVEPVIAKTYVESEAIKVKPGQTAGLTQKARGVKEGKETIALHFQAYIGAQEEYDAITIDGVPNINQRIQPCVHGDIGTIAMIVNTIPKVINSPAGLLTMKDLPVPSAALGDMRKYIEM
ncbi:MAG: NADP-binding protein [Candidatus Bathyarchaeota archaeon]|nr:NADP-binding protein [Candidatus Bathyarchaeota archaeon]MDH5732292.1 NADP-binding protein [Candidatus Bathyarchaeota archaeon]